MQSLIPMIFYNERIFLFFLLDQKEAKNQEQTIYSPFVQQQYSAFVQSKLNIDIGSSHISEKTASSKQETPVQSQFPCQQPN